MRQYPEKIAWLILLTSFVLFCFLALAIPLTIRWWVINAEDSHDATLEVISGTVLVRDKGFPPDVGVTSEKKVPEGSIVRTDSNSSALLTFFDGSSLTIFPSTEIQLVKVRSPRFHLSPRPNTITVEQNVGRIRAAPILPQGRSTQWQLITPHATLALSEGSHAVLVNNELSEVVVRKGAATVEAQGETVTLGAGKRVKIALGEGPSDLLPASRNLLTNSDFSQGLTGWRTYSASGQEGVKGGEVELVDSDGRKALRFFRQGEDGIHTEAGIVQNINQDISDYISLQLRLDVMVNFHSLSGGGYLSSEYPVIVRIDYEDEYGSAAHWYHGFYYQNSQNNPTLNGEEIRQSVWYPYEKVDLLDLDPRPYYIRSLQIYASGWNYDSLVAEVGLLVE